MNTCLAAAIRRNAAWLTRIISMFAPTSPSVKRLMSAPAEKNFGLALWTITTRASPASAASTASENSVMNARSYEFAGGWSSVMKPSGPCTANVTAIRTALRPRRT